MKPLTPKQLAFSEAVISGKDQSAAYREAYRCPKSSPTTVAVEASRTRQLSHVAAYIEAAQGKLANKGIVTRVRTLELLRDIAEATTDPARTGDRIRALRLSSEIQGFLVNRQEFALGGSAGSVDLLAHLLKAVRDGSAPVKPAVVENRGSE